MMVRGLIERDSGAGSFVPTDHGRAALEALLSRPLWGHSLRRTAANGPNRRFAAAQRDAGNGAMSGRRRTRPAPLRSTRRLAGQWSAGCTMDFIRLTGSRRSDILYCGPVSWRPVIRCARSVAM